MTMMVAVTEVWSIVLHNHQIVQIWPACFPVRPIWLTKAHIAEQYASQGQYTNCKCTLYFAICTHKTSPNMHYIALPVLPILQLHVSYCSGPSNSIIICCLKWKKLIIFSSFKRLHTAARQGFLSLSTVTGNEIIQSFYPLSCFYWPRRDLLLEQDTCLIKTLWKWRTQSTCLMREAVWSFIPLN